AAQNHFVAAEQRRHRVRLDHAALLEVDGRMESKSSGDARHRVEVDVRKLAISPRDVPECCLTVLKGPRLVFVRILYARLQVRLAFSVELDWQVLEAHERELLWPRRIVTPSSQPLRYSRGCRWCP